MTAKYCQQTDNKQVIGNQALYYVAFMLSRRGLNAILTSRNSRGADILVVNDDCSVARTIQVKGSTRRCAVNIGRTPERDDPPPPIACDYWIFVDLGREKPACYIFTRKELEPLRLANRYAGKDGKWNWWLQPKNIYDETSLEKWDKIRI